MDDLFIKRKIQNERIEKYQYEIQLLLQRRPELQALQQKIEDRLDRIGSVETEEGRKNRAIMAFELLMEEFATFRQGISEYQSGLSEALAGRRKPSLRIIK